jgi:uncharacterized protein (DUF983 family)
MQDHPLNRYPHGQTCFSLSMRGVCPRCGRGRLFEGWLRLAKSCDQCGLDYSFADPADGPAFFAQWLACIPALLAGVWLELKYEPPIWMHVLTTLPLLVIPCVLLLRPLKAWFVCSQYANAAGESRLH